MLQEIIRLERLSRHDLMADAKFTRGARGVCTLVCVVASRANGERLDIAAKGPGRPANQCRVDAAAQQRTDRHVCLEPEFGRLDE